MILSAFEPQPVNVAATATENIRECSRRRYNLPPATRGACSAVSALFFPSMIDAHEFLRNLALVLCAAAFTAVVFQRLRLPVVFGYLIAGMAVGPHLPIPLVADERMVHALSELGDILLMYKLGLDVRFRKLL